MNTVEIIETHAHLYLEDYTNDLDQVILRAGQEGIKKIYMPALKNEYVDRMLRLEKEYPGMCVPMIGIHPAYIREDYEKELELLKEWLKKRAFAAIGEIGLDYYRDTAFKVQQSIAFREQIDLSLQYNLPIVIHSRAAMEDTLEILKTSVMDGARGIFHCFSGTIENASEIIGYGFLLGIGGVVTYKNAGLAEVVAQVPLEHIVLETDAPYLTPAPFRGKRNESSYLKYVVKKIAELKGVSEEEVAQVTTSNARKIFKEN
ncbi:MAG: TatD family hydrolase [Flavitalea sp.]